MRYGDHYLDFDIISKKRSELMGLATLGILVGHFVSLSGLVFSGVSNNIVAQFSNLLFTEGFLLLSGFGLCYSRCIKGDWDGYAQRRFSSVFLPYLIIFFPFACYFAFIGKDNSQELVLKLSTISFWVYGNYYGMWYISVSILLYAMFPVIYRLQIAGEKNILLRTLVIICCLLFFTELLKRCCPEYYEIIAIGLTKIPCFIIGVYLGWCAARKKRLTISYVLVILLIGGVSWIYKSYDNGVYFNIVSKLIKIPLLCVCLLFISTWDWGKVVNGLFSWVGRFSLEIYMLHLLIYNVLDSCYFESLDAIVIAIVLSLVLCSPVNAAVSYLKNLVISHCLSL